MGNSIEDTNRNFRTILFLVLFSLLLLSSQDIQDNHNTLSGRNSAQTELFSGGFSNLNSTVQCRPFSLPDLCKFCECAPSHTDLIPFSIRNKISDYNRQIARTYILINKARLSTEPNSQLRFYYHLPSNRDDDLPALS
jgi:hypothetical protein